MASPSPTPQPTPTITPNVTPTITVTPSVTPSTTLSPTPTVTPTQTVTPSFTSDLTPTPTNTITPTVTPTVTPTASTVAITKVNLQEFNIVSGDFGTSEAKSSIKLKSNGILETFAIRYDREQQFQYEHLWGRPLNGDPSNYEVRFDTSDISLISGSNANSWLDLTIDREWIVQSTTSAVLSATGLLSIRRASDSVVVAEKRITLTTFNFVPTPTPTITATNTITPTVTPTISNTITPTVTPTVTPTNTIAPTVTPTLTPTVTPSATPEAIVSTGYVSGGYVSGAGGVSTIDSYPFSVAFTAATNIGNLSSGRYGNVGQSSTENAYSSGGYPYNFVERFPFSSPFTSVTNVGSVQPTNGYTASHSGNYDGYMSGGVESPGFIESTVIQSFPFSSPFTQTTNIGDLTGDGSFAPVGLESNLNAYTTTGQNFGTGSVRDNVDRFPLSSPFTTSTNIGSFGGQTNDVGSGQSSENDGYVSGGFPTSGNTTIQSFPFSSPFTTTISVGDISEGSYGPIGVSSNDDGYVNSFPSTRSRIEKFPFSSSFTNTTFVGDLSQGRYSGGGHQG